MCLSGITPLEETWITQTTIYISYSFFFIPGQQVDDPLGLTKFISSIVNQSKKLAFPFLLGHQKLKNEKENILNEI